MAVSVKHVLEQGPAIRGMGEAALAVLKQRLGMGASGAAPHVPGPEITETFPPRSKELVRDYVRHVGGDPSSYRGRVPAHLFPQWGFALQGKTLEGLRYPLARAMNGGCRLIQSAPLPDDEPLFVRANLESVDDDGRRAILEQKIVTSTPSAPDAVVAHLFVFVPLGGGKQENKNETRETRDKPRVDADAREIAFWRLRADAGLDFAKLTGDFNPVHWVPAYARAFGFKNTILHGFGTMARAIEGLNRALFAGDVDAWRQIEVRFTRPLVLPAKVGLYVKHEAGGVNRVWVGTAPGGPAFLQGTFQTSV
ncbi:MAG: hypothetical protein K8H88_08545 [Sandaracinaceae bacterium]|nr:hypothetical protein [Sandaracinaceae bacterium]